MPRNPTKKNQPISTENALLEAQTQVRSVRERRYKGKDLIEAYMTQMRTADITVVDAIYSHLKLILYTLSYVALLTETEYTDYLTIARNIVKSRRSQVQ